MPVSHDPRNAKTGLRRGLAERCPHCGEGRLFRAYLKVAPNCPSCGHDTGAYQADDGPAYFTILLVGHLVIAPLLCLSFIWTWPVGVVLALTFPVVIAITLLALPRVKGAFIGMQWALQAAAAP